MDFQGGERTIEKLRQTTINVSHLNVDVHAHNASYAAGHRSQASHPGSAKLWSVVAAELNSATASRGRAVRAVPAGAFPGAGVSWGHTGVAYHGTGIETSQSPTPQPAPALVAMLPVKVEVS